MTTTTCWYCLTPYAMSCDKCPECGWNKRGICEKCHVGSLKPGSIVLECNPPLYPHFCDSCGHQQLLDDWLPTSGRSALLPKEGDRP